ncbi:MAG: CHAT domain-containing protein [Coleofasciculaceae cyanobacterium SM2_1_6]|nr:CHAT domain-containing protein [Coleofasciculaceae cyanobacterium SM2_1_6]
MECRFSRYFIFAGHGKEEQNRGKICLNDHETLSVEEIRYALQKRIQEGLQLAIFNSCDGLELGEDLADLHIPQAIVMKEAVPDVIAQRFLKDFLREFSGGVPLVQALRQTRNKLTDWDKDYPYASWLPVLYCNPTEPLMQWSRPQPPFLQRYPWQTKLAASFLLGLAVISNLGVLSKPPTIPVDQPNVISSEIKTTKVYEEKSYGIKIEYPTNWVLQEKFDSITGDVIKLFPADNPEVELILNVQDLSENSLDLEKWKEKIVADLQKYSESFTLLQTEQIALDYKPGHKLTYTTTRQGIRYQAVDIFAQKGNKSYMFTYITPASARSLFVDYQSQAQKIVDSLAIVN